MLSTSSVEHCLFFFFNDTATTEIYTLSLHDALPISCSALCCFTCLRRALVALAFGMELLPPCPGRGCLRSARPLRSEEHTSEIQSRLHLVCRLLLGKKKQCSIDTVRSELAVIVKRRA